jgi:hypothetical protein
VQIDPSDGAQARAGYGESMKGSTPPGDPEDPTERVAPRRTDKHPRHPIRSPKDEVDHLREVEEEGESGATPAIAFGGLLLVLIPVALVLAGVVFLAVHFIGGDDGKSKPAAAAVPWTLPNGDLSNTRATRNTSISASTVDQLGVAWTMPLTAISTYGTFAANPVTSPDGTVYLQDLQSNVSAVNLKTGKVLCLCA